MSPPFDPDAGEPQGEAEGVIEVGDQGSLIRGRQVAGTPQRGPLRRPTGAGDDKAGEVLILASQAIGQQRPQTRSREPLLTRIYLQTSDVMIDGELLKEFVCVQSFSHSNNRFYLNA